MKFVQLLVLVAGLVLPATMRAGTSPNASGACVTCLGPFLGVTSPDTYLPLDNFRKVHVSLRQFGLPEFLYLSIPKDDQSTVQAWPVVKALNQFGSLRGVNAVERSCRQVNVPGYPTSLACNLPTLDLSHAVYRSRYLRFVYGAAGTFLRTEFRSNRALPKREATLFQRYACSPSRVACSDPRARVADFLEIIEGYEQTASQFLNRYVFQLPVSNAADAMAVTPKFDTVRGALASGTEPASGSFIVTYVNGEANIMTALICHADGAQPKKVCSRSVIKQILHHVK